MASCYIRTDSISRDESCIRWAVQSLQRDPHEARASAEEAGKARADEGGRHRGAEQVWMLCAGGEGGAADRGNRGPSALRYDAPPHLRKRHLVERNDLIPRSERVEPADGALQLGAPGGVLDGEIQVVTVGVDAHLPRMVQHRVQMRGGIVELHRGARGVEVGPWGPGHLKIEALLSVAPKAGRVRHTLRVRHVVTDRVVDQRRTSARTRCNAAHRHRTWRTDIEQVELPDGRGRARDRPVRSTLVEDDPNPRGRGAGVCRHGVVLRRAAERERLPAERIRYERPARHRCGQWPREPKDPERSNERRREDGMDRSEARAEPAQVGEGTRRFTAPRSGEHQRNPGDQSHEARSLPSSTPASLDCVTTGSNAYAPIGNGELGERRRSESNRRIEVLQTSALPLGYGAVGVKSHQNTWVSQPRRASIRCAARASTC